jgi:branched-chain amino acid transport system ATP-binding protein
MSGDAPEPDISPKNVDPLLRVEGIHVHYGRSRALTDVSFEMQNGEALAVLGANGAGKSTLARSLSGLIGVSTGRIQFAGLDITGWPANRIRMAGLNYLPEGRGIFPGLSVMDNLRMGVQFLSGKKERRTALDRAVELFPVLQARRNQRAGSLSGGEQQMLSLARGLAVNPLLLIADELSLGLAPLLVDVVFSTLEMARSEGVTILLIEQFAERALEFADNCLILQRGSIEWQGRAADAEEELLERYLGKETRSGLDTPAATL